MTIKELCTKVREAPACSYCGATEGLRQHHDGGGYIAPDYVCEDCFTGSDTGPDFDDLPLAPTGQSGDTP